MRVELFGQRNVLLAGAEQSAPHVPQQPCGLVEIRPGHLAVGLVVRADAVALVPDQPAARWRQAISTVVAAENDCRNAKVKQWLRIERRIVAYDARQVFA